MNENVNLVSNNEQAVEELMGEQYAEWLINKIGHEVGNWPELQTISASKPKIEKIRKFMLQLFLSDEAFVGARDGDPGFLRFAIANLSESPDPSAESALEVLEARRQEELTGHKVEKGIVVTRRRELWIKMLKALEIPVDEINKAESKEATRNYIAELSDIYSTSEWQTVIGAFAALEKGMAVEFAAVVAMLKNSTSLTDAELEVLSAHTAAHNKHLLDISHILDRIAFDQESKGLIWDGVKRHLETKKEFYANLVKHLE